jgi:MtaA/CmuA family methyltransferase
MNNRERVLAMMDHRPADRIPLMPITMMFAGDQIGVRYGDYVKDFRLLAEAQIRTAEKFDLDLVSCISDPAREAADLGAAVRYFDDQPPGLDESNALLAEKTVLVGLKIPDPLGGGRMHDRVKAAALLKEKVAGERIVEGWIEGPCAQAANLRGINTLMLDFSDDPVFVRDLFDFVVEMELRFAEAQKDAGAELMGVGDAAASLVGPAIFEEFVVPAQRKLLDGLRAMGLRTTSHICGNTKRIMKSRGELGYDIVEIDSMVSLADARMKMPNQVILGNVATVEVLQNGSAEDVLAAVTKCHQDSGELYIVGAGCEVPRKTPLANMIALCEYAHSHKPSCLTA